MNRFLTNARWVLAWATCALWLAAPSLAAPMEHPEFCSSITGPTVSCVNQLETYLTTPIPGYTYAWSTSPGGTPSTLTGPSTLVNWTTAGAQWVALQTTVPGGGTTVCTLYVTVYPRPAPAIFSDFISDCPEGKEDPHHGQGKEECWVVCENMTVNYTSNNVLGNTYQWVIVGGTPTSATGSSVSVTWGAPGSGMIILTETSPGGCSETIEQCVTIIESPEAWFTFNGQDPSSTLVVCLGETVYFDDQSVGGAFWYWDFGDGYTSTLQNPSHTYSSPGTYNGMLTVTNECGCSAQVPFEIKVTPVASPVIGCISTVCLNDCAFYSVSNVCDGGSVTWAIHGGQILNQPTPGSVNVIWDDNDGFIAANGYGEICVTVTGCPDLCDGEVCVRVPVIHKATISGETVVCVGDPVTFSVPALPGINEPGGPMDGVDFDWVVSGGSIISTPPYSNSITVVFPNPGTYTVSLNAYENYLTNSDCKFEPDPITVVVKPTFIIYPPTATICLYDNQTFNVTGAGFFDWTVTGPGGVIGPVSGGTSYNVSPPAPGVYAVSAQSTSGVYCNVTPTAVLEVLAPPPTPAGALIGEVNICPNTPYVYTFSTLPPPGTVLMWDIVGGTLYGGAGQTVTAEWTGGGPMSLSVYLRNTDFPYCESAPISFTINAYTPPATFVTGPTSVCVDEQHTFSISGLSNYTDLQWSVSPATAGSVVIGHGTPSIDVLFSNTAPPVVQVICTATVCGTPITDVFNVTVNQIPAYTIVSPATACQNELVPFSVTPTFGIAGYSWSFGSASATPTNSWPATGTYTVTVDLNLNICGNPTVTAATTIQIDPVPVAYVTASNGYSICPPVTSTTLTVATQIFCNYNWSGGGGTGPTLLVTAPGTYTVTATDPVTGCSAVITKVVIGCPPVCPSNATPWDFTWSENCDTYTFNPVPSGSSTYVGWAFGDLTGSTSAGSQVHTYDHPGYYQVTIFSYDPVAQCTLAIAHTITVKFKGNFTVNYDCSSGTMLTTLTDISEYLLPAFPATTPQWFNPGLLGSGSTLTTALSPVPQSVYLQVVVGGQTCVSPTQTFTPPGMPAASFINNAPACEGMPVLFTNTSTGGGLTGYAWSFGDGAGSGLMNPQRSYDAPPSTYTVTLTIGSEWGCTSSSTATVTINQRSPDPIITIVPNTPVCEGTPVLLTATGALPGPVTYSWYNSTDPGTVLSGTNTYTATSSGLYGVSATDNNGCLYNVLAPDAVVMYPPPYVQITGKTDYCVGDIIQVSADAGALIYAWTIVTPYGTFTPTTPSVSTNGFVAGTYTYTVTITDPVSGCTNSGTMAVEVHVGPTGLAITSSANCAPATLLATASGATQFNWSTGTVGTSTSVLTGGFYSVIASDAWGCTAQEEYELMNRPDLSNVMVGCYEFCDKVTWQAPNCPSCTYQWTLNGTPIPGETNPTIDITTSGVYTVIVSNGPGCESESDPIDISIALSPDLCDECKVEIHEYKFRCIGIDPGTGLPLYEFWIDVQNFGGALYGLTALTSLGTITLIDPASGYIPGGGAVTTLHGYLAWNGGDLFGCISFLAYLTADCETQKECKFEWCGELPKCCEGDCDFLMGKVKVECIAGGFYKVKMELKNNGCDLFNLYIKTPYGIYPMTPSTLPGGGTVTIVTAIIEGHPGSMGVTICGTRFDGKECCIEVKLQMPECHDTDCHVHVQPNQIVCVGFTPDGFPIFEFNFIVSIVPGGSAIYVLPNQPGIVTGVMYTCIGGVCTVQGTYTDYSGKDALCFTVITVDGSEPPKICIGKICFHRPPCSESPGKPGESLSRNNKLEKQAAGEFFLVPNPAMNEVRITGLATDPAETIDIRLTDMVGHCYLSLRASGNTPPRLDVSTLPAGVYIVTVADSQGVPVSRKLTIVR